MANKSVVYATDVKLFDKNGRELRFPNIEVAKKAVEIIDIYAELEQLSEHPKIGWSKDGITTSWIISIMQNGKALDIETCNTIYRVI